MLHGSHPPEGAFGSVVWQKGSADWECYIRNGAQNLTLPPGSWVAWLRTDSGVSLQAVEVRKHAEGQTVSVLSSVESTAPVYVVCTTDVDGAMRKSDDAVVVTYTNQSDANEHPVKRTRHYAIEAKATKVVKTSDLKIGTEVIARATGVETTMWQQTHMVVVVANTTYRLWRYIADLTAGKDWVVVSSTEIGGANATDPPGSLDLVTLYGDLPPLAALSPLPPPGVARASAAFAARHGHTQGSGIPGLALDMAADAFLVDRMARRLVVTINNMFLASTTVAAHPYPSRIFVREAAMHAARCCRRASRFLVAATAVTALSSPLLIVGDPLFVMSADAAHALRALRCASLQPVEGHRGEGYNVALNALAGALHRAATGVDKALADVTRADAVVRLLLAMRLPAATNLCAWFASPTAALACAEVKMQELRTPVALPVGNGFLSEMAGIVLRGHPGAILALMIADRVKAGQVGTDRSNDVVRRAVGASSVARPMASSVDASGLLSVIAEAWRQRRIPSDARTPYSPGDEYRDAHRLDPLLQLTVALSKATLDRTTTRTEYRCPFGQFGPDTGSIRPWADAMDAPVFPFEQSVSQRTLLATVSMEEPKCEAADLLVLQADRKLVIRVATVPTWQTPTSYGVETLQGRGELLCSEILTADAAQTAGSAVDPARKPFIVRATRHVGVAHTIAHMAERLVQATLLALATAEPAKVVEKGSWLPLQVDVEDQTGCDKKVLARAVAIANGLLVGIVPIPPLLSYQQSTAKLLSDTTSLQSACLLATQPE